MSKVSRYLKGQDLDPHFSQKLLDELVKFNDRTEALDNVQELTQLNATVISLKKQISNMEIGKEKREHEFKLRETEIQHMVGLERKRSESEAKQAAADARIAVKEENLEHERTRFSKEMEFMQGRLEHEVEAMRGMYEAILSKLPTVNVDRKINEHIGDQPAAIEAKVNISGKDDTAK